MKSRQWIPAVTMTLFVFIVSPAMIACTGHPVPLSAQAGSTILIPLRGVTDGTIIGYGGSLVTDYQRGELVFRLDGPTGPELITRGTSVVAAAQTTRGARQGTIAGSLQVVAMVDIPADAPEGTHTLHVSRRRIEAGSPVEYSFPAYPAEIQILPNEVTAGSETVIGMETPLEAYVFGWTDESHVLPEVTPDPQLRFAISPAVFALEMTVTYPASVANVIDVVEPALARANNLASVWFSEPVPGTVHIKAVAQTLQFNRVALVFALDDGAAAILDPNAVTVTIDKAFNQSGAPVTATVTSKTSGAPAESRSESAHSRSRSRLPRAT
jgi:hypothetical protein